MTPQRRAAFITLQIKNLFNRRWNVCSDALLFCGVAGKLLQTFIIT